MARTIDAKYFVSLLRASVGDNSADDLVLHWLEDCLTFIRDKPWPWNWTRSKVYTVAPRTQDGCTWNKGDSYITVSTGVTVGKDTAGMVVEIDDIRYRVRGAGYPVGTRITLDAPLTTANPTVGKSLVFYQDSFCVKTTNIGNVDIAGDRKLVKVNKDIGALHRHGHLYERTSPATPTRYFATDSVEIEPPLYPPAVVAAGAGTMAAGKYIYFYTRYDSIRGIESKPGPYFEWDNSTGVPGVVTYGNPSGDQSESTSYKLRLYRSEVNPTSIRCPMYLIETRDGSTPASSFVDNNTSPMYGNERYWCGPYALVEPYPIPDEEYLFDVYHLDSWYYRPNLRDRINVGRNISFVEAITMYIQSGVSLSARDPKTRRAAIISFRQQVMYLLQKETDVAASDIAEHEHMSLHPVTDHNDGDWVDRLRWSDY